MSAGITTVYPLVRMRAEVSPTAPALSQGAETLDFRTLVDRIDRVAAGLAARGVGRGARVAILSENSIAYSVVQLACAKLGAIAACQNWRLADPELVHCIGLVAPVLLLASDRHRALAERVASGVPVAPLDGIAADGDTQCAAQPEDGLLIIYTSGTTGLPKAAVISHRAEIARMCALRLDLGLSGEDGYVAWAPMFHMGGTEHLLATLMSGGHAIVVDGFDAGAIADALATYRIGWLLLVPATIEPLLAEIAARSLVPVGVKAVGCMADLVPAATIAAITTALDAPYLDTFGATETGMPPLSAGLVPVGTAPDRFPKRLSVLTELRLVAGGEDVAAGDVGEAWVRGPTLFSGYWRDGGISGDCFVDGWFPMGDLFRREADGYMFVGRSKYLIKSGGENIYPAEIERVLLADARVADAIVVRRPDDRWGEVPVAVIARCDDALDADAVDALCRAQLAGYKRPREIRFVALDDFPRSASGKIIREAVEAMIG